MVIPIKPVWRSKRVIAGGQAWDDVQTLDKIIHNTRLNLSGSWEP
jgi:hypothetical protein